MSEEVWRWPNGRTTSCRRVGDVSFDLYLFFAFANLGCVISGLDAQHEIDLWSKSLFDSQSQIRRKRSPRIHDGGQRRSADPEETRCLGHADAEGFQHAPIKDLAWMGWVFHRHQH